VPNGSDLSYHLYRWNRKGFLESAIPSSGSTSRSLTLLWAKNGSDNPKWRSQIRKGYDAGTDFSGTRQHDFTEDGNTSLEYEAKEWPSDKKWLPGWSHSWGLPESESTTMQSVPSDDTTVLNVAKARFANNVRESYSSLQGLVSLGEIGETLRMIRRPFKTMREDVPRYLDRVKVRTRKVRSKAEARKIVADTWLEQAFGWRPLMSDIVGGAEALDRFQRSGAIDVRQKVQAQATKETLTFLATAQNQSSSNSDFLWNHKRLRKTYVQYVLTGGVKIKDKGRVAAAQRLLGFRLEEFVPTLWELLPWSFLIDYFTNIGDVIDSWSLNGADLYYWNKTRRLVGVCDYTYTPNYAATRASKTQPNLSRVTSISGSLSRRYTENRSINRDAKPVESLTPAFMFTVPGCSTKFVNIAALAATRDSSRRIFSRLG
jgi:hypothetical protein